MAQFRNRGSNVWQIGIYLGKDDEGKKQTHYETFYGSKPQAKLYAGKIEAELKKKMNVPKAHDMTMNNLFDDYLKYKETRIELSTYKTYERQIDRLRPLVGNLYLYSVNSEQIRKSLKPLEDDSNLKPRTIKNLYDMLRFVVNWGLSKKYLNDDIVAGLESPMIGHVKRSVLNEDELKLFIKAAKGYKHYLPLKILALTGMRIGELIGLRWENVLLDSNTIKIVEAVNSRTKYLKSTKNKNSKREIELDEEIIQELKEHKKVMVKLSRAKDSDFVFQSDNGKFLGHETIFKTKESVLKKAGLHHIRIHDLRHGVGSILLDHGESITTVAEQLGQVPSTTAGNYSHALKKGHSLAILLK
ncbi:tyrosine-type recombinase/integrase [Desulfitobacterium metallireducens]|uniref:Integrase n=1 Tax=Desulfitobacterium metallireducens DSM 15288 TaxID=871968 RepID=W0EDB7_9FIRM|nr:site-specific integrase [Desulfitobacterium metallireducens]AHF07164.1 integrase [Desulfitobacterium metallireducens DSM 15288]